MRKYVFLFLIPHIFLFAEHQPSHFEKLLVHIESGLSDRDRAVILSSNFFSEFMPLPRKLDKGLVEQAEMELASESKINRTTPVGSVLSVHLASQVAAELKFREMNNLSMEERTWIRSSIFYLMNSTLDKLVPELNSKKNSSGELNLIDVVNFLERQASSRLIPFEVKVIGELESISHLTFPKNVNLYTIIDFTCGTLEHKPDVYFSYPYLVFEGEIQSSKSLPSDAKPSPEIDSYSSEFIISY